MSELSAESSASNPVILLASAAGGKTQRLVELLVHDPKSTRPRWAVLPDRVQVVAFRRRLALAGGRFAPIGALGPGRGALGVSVGTFADLFQEILARAGRPVAVAPQPARQRLLRLAIRELDAAGELPTYHPIAGTPGFLEALADAIAELKRARIAAEAVRDVEKPQLSEIARIYAAYQARLEAIPWTDREGLNHLAIDALNRDTALMADIPLIVVDGFDSFEAAQLEALQALAGQVDQLVVSLPGARQTDRAAYRRFAGPLHRLRQALPQASIEELERSGSQAEPLAQLEAGLFERDPEPTASEEAIEMLETRGQAEEAREAMRWLKARLVRDRLSLEDCALIAPDPERYRPLLRRAADEFGIRLRFTQGERLIGAPAVSAMIDLLELNRSNWPRRLTLQTVRSPYLDLSPWGLQPTDAVALDAASHAGQVTEGLDQWEQALEPLVRVAVPADAQDEPPTFSTPTGESAARLLGALQKLAKRLTPAGHHSMAGWVEWLEDLLDEIQFPERTGGERDRPVFLRVREALRALLLGELVAGRREMSFGEFLDELRGALEAASYREDRPFYEPAVNVLRLLEARGARYQAVVVLGLSEGLLPEVEREDPFLDESTRQALGLEPRLGREQAGLFYQALTRADARLLLTRPYLAEDGEAWQPSPFWQAVEALLAESPRRIRPEDPRPLADAGSPQELLFWGVRRGGMPESMVEPYTERWTNLQHAREVLAARGDVEPAGPHEGDLGVLARALSSRYGEEHIWSPSRLESYGICPHMFLTSSVLGLEIREPPEPGLDARQLGLILHEILEMAYGGADDPTDVESVLEAVERVLDPILDRAPETYGFRPTPLWAIERRQYAEALRDSVRALAEVGQGWTPMSFELRFGIDDCPPLELDLGGRTVRVRGIIDRLDRRADGGLRVIDYKTGSGRLNVRELDEGRRIQLPLYALAAQTALGLGQVVEGFYWAILAAKPSTLRLSNYRLPDEVPGTGPAAAYATARRHVDRITAGARAGQFEPVPPPGGCPKYCPAAAWCWRYQPAGWG
ncbi:MAG: PD-(D/E)XK nuclease family protein [Anaerolineales bacterium]